MERRITDGHGYELVKLPRTVRNPDMAFIAASQLPPEGVGPGFFKLAPDLVVEVLSPSERAWRLQEKLRDYFAAGTREIWVIDPKSRSIVLISAGGSTRTFSENETFDGGDLLPGFQMAVAALFEGFAR